ncbi:meiotically up-regulated gene 56 protein [Stemphylium lycopersici]|nr:meiotically up-regulated gene 56 protein [Stemphylium lycopersici]
MVIVSSVMLGDANLYHIAATYIPLGLVIYYLLWILYTLTLHPLSKIPGPFWPSISRTWLMYHHHAGDVEIATRILHKKYGPIVRIAPEEVTVADPNALPLIYPFQKPLQKTDWYGPWRPKGLDSQPDLFTQTDEKAHTAYRRIVGGVYSLSSILKSEPKLDEMLKLFLERLGGFADSGETFDFGLWLEMQVFSCVVLTYAFDNIGVAFFGQAFGFLQDSIDYRGYIHAVHLAMPFLTLLTVTPYYARPLLLLVALCIPQLLRAVLAVEDIKETAIRETKTAMERTSEAAGKRTDIVSQLLAIVQEKGEKVNYSHKEITSDAWVGITSVTMRSVFYFLMKNPEKLAKARAEIDAAFEDGTLSSPIQYAQASTLPYLTAVVKEAMRVFSPFAVSMPRYAPSQGLTLCDKYIPAGFTIGINPAIKGRTINTLSKRADREDPRTRAPRSRSSETVINGYDENFPEWMMAAGRGGPDTTAWLSKHRRDWYKHHLRINYSTRTATFSSDPREARQRRLSGIEGPSSSALFQHSFPQPEDVDAEDEEEEVAQHSEASGANGTAGATAATPPALQIPRGSEQKEDVIADTEEDEFVDAPSEPEDDNVEYAPNRQLQRRRSSDKTFVTASSVPTADEDHVDRLRDEGPEQQDQNQHQTRASGLQVPSGQSHAGSKSLGKRPLSNVESIGDPASTTGPASVDANSTSSLLRKADMNKAPALADVDSRPPAKGILARVKRRSEMRSSSSGQVKDADPTTAELTRKKSNLRNLVKFDVPEDSRRATVQLKAKKAQMTIQRAGTKVRRQKIKDGLVIKMERMLVRVDAAAEVPEDFDENVNQRVVSRVKDKWREYMVVCRHSHLNNADFVLQFYQTRVIPEIENSGAGKKAAYEVPLGRKTCKVNLYSSLDKSMVISSPGARKTLIFIMQARTACNAVEWYTFLRNILGWQRASELQINIPDMSLNVRILNPFEKLEASQSKVQHAENTEEALLKTMEEEQAVAEDLIRRCLDQLQEAPEWSDVLASWIKDQRIGLAWKRYDRLEWIHGANERKMYGTIAMLKSHELELRPKTHYPTTAITRKKHKTLTEPVPVEGFLIRLTGQRGRAKRLGLMYHKQLYFASHDQYLVFSRPTKVTPPPPPRLPASGNSAVPTAQAVKGAVPESWDVNPYRVQNGQIEWLVEGQSGTTEVRRLHDEDAADEAERKGQNLLNCDGYINLADVVKVRKARMGASPADEDLEEGSDVDFDEEVDDSMNNDGATNDLDIERTMELVMKNGLIIRLQAANNARRKEWIQHLRALVKYWKHRTAGDIALYKATRGRNLSVLKIDEEAEAHVGQFARKWEVTQSFASPELYNMCGIASCRTIHMSGMLYRKPRIHAPFTRCGVLLTAGTLLIFCDVLRSRSGKQLAHIHHERIANLDLKDCYIYSGLLTESDLLYQNQTFDANKPGHHALPRIYLEDGWTSTDEDVMTTFVIWHGKAKSWFRAEEGAGGGEQSRKEGKRMKLKRVAKLGSKGRSVVFRARSRAERDHWVLAIQNEIERVQGDNADFRLEESGNLNRSDTGV